MKVLIWFTLFFTLLIYAFIAIDILAELREREDSTLMYVLTVLAFISPILTGSWALYLLWFQLNK